MSRTYTAPPRLFATVCRVWGPEPVTGGPCAWEDVPFVLDLEDIVGMRATVDLDGDTKPEPVPGACLESRRGSIYVTTPLAEVVSAWVAFRTHADALNRIRN